MVGFTLLSRSYYYLRRRSPGPPFPPDHRQEGERGAIIKIISVRAAWATPSLALPLEIGAIAPLVRCSLAAWPRSQLAKSGFFIMNESGFERFYFVISSSRRFQKSQRRL